MALKQPSPLCAQDLTLAPAFDCGIDVLNLWLRDYAWTNHQSGSARVYVTVDPKQSLIAGYYCLSAAQVMHGEASKRVSKGLARHPIPVVLIGRFAVDRRFQGSGLGRLLIRDAFQRVLETGEVIGVRAIMVRAKNEAAAEFYRKLGFAASASDPMLFFHLLKDVKKSLEVAAS